jgi:REP element-mobilizing transposase RayT
LQACRYWDSRKIDLHAAVVMPDHVHLLLQSRPVEGKDMHLQGDATFDLTEILHSIKSFSAHEITKRNRCKGAVWQHESYDRIVRDNEEFEEKRTYIANNAVIKGLAKRPEAYPWLWYRGIEPETTASGTLAPPSVENSSKLVSSRATVPVATGKPSTRKLQ